ncbi:hypothetical protein ONA92_03975 [Mycobacteroides salmoniphilum]|uniref:hypothetical protein n=1 Tax=Mycobacteroides salmoniphilum TaxID=404941 RepID=UPI0035643883
MSDLPKVDRSWYLNDTAAASPVQDEVGLPAADEPQGLLEAIVRLLAVAAPVVWEQLNGAFSIAGEEEVMQAVALTSRHSHSIPIESEVADMIRRHRRISIGPGGPWLRLTFECRRDGGLIVGFDYGAVELPSDYLLSPEAYRRDIAQYPREKVPLWLRAYMGNDGRQMRSASQARTAVSRGIGEARVADDEIPPLPQLWARIAVLAAVCRGSDATVGAVTDPSFQRYSGPTGGCLLARLPGGRGVLSGGCDNSRLLAAAYQGVTGWPDFYRGAPAWLHNLYLDPRAAAGRLSFCYWWAGGHWYRAELSEFVVEDETARGVPDVGTADRAAEQVVTILRTVGGEPTDGATASALRLVCAAETGTASERHLVELFAEGVPQTVDIAEALTQLDAADVLRQD